jgi:hypothetical protein
VSASLLSPKIIDDPQGAIVWMGISIRYRFAILEIKTENFLFKYKKSWM